MLDVYDDPDQAVHVGRIEPFRPTCRRRTSSASTQVPMVMAPTRASVPAIVIGYIGGITRVPTPHTEWRWDGSTIGHRGVRTRVSGHRCDHFWCSGPCHDQNTGRGSVRGARGAAGSVRRAFNGECRGRMCSLWGAGAVRSPGHSAGLAGLADGRQGVAVAACGYTVARVIVAIAHRTSPWTSARQMVSLRPCLTTCADATTTWPVAGRSRLIEKSAVRMSWS